MASASRKHNLTGVFPQRKKATSAAGKNTSSDKVTRKDLSIVSKSVKQDLSGDADESLNILSQFDMNMAYGPCLGITRMERWERASRLGLDPPVNVRNMLVNLEAAIDCLWEGRV